MNFEIKTKRIKKDRLLSLLEDGDLIEVWYSWAAAEDAGLAIKQNVAGAWFLSGPGEVESHPNKMYVQVNASQLGKIIRR